MQLRCDSRSRNGSSYHLERTMQFGDDRERATAAAAKRYIPGSTSAAVAMRARTRDHQGDEQKRAYDDAVGVLKGIPGVRMKAAARTSTGLVDAGGGGLPRVSAAVPAISLKIRTTVFMTGSARSSPPTKAASQPAELRRGLPHRGQQLTGDFQKPLDDPLRWPYRPVEPP